MRVETESAPRNKDPGRTKAPSVMRKRALVVDDERATQILIQEVLASAEIEALTFGNSMEADDHLQAEKFDVVLVGQCGLSVDGIELVRKIRASGFNRLTPVIMISDDQRPGALCRGFEAGASFFVYKPVSKAHLMGLIRVTQGTIEREKRRFRRVPVNARVRIKSSKMEVVGETIDISLNGALVTAPHTIPIGSLVEISLYLLAEAEPVVGLGTIVRILSDNQMGILLDRLSVEESGRLQEYLLPRIAD